MALYTNVSIKDREFENERLELSDKGSLYFLGPNLTVRNSTVVFKVAARNLFFKGARFIDCTLEIKQELKNHQAWVFASLKGCRIKGRLSGCDLGRWPGYSSEPWAEGSIEDCDFTEARMDGCRLHGCDTRTIQFPRWPCFTILNPFDHGPELNSVKWPELFGAIFIEGLQHKHPPSTVSMTWHAPTIAKHLKTTPEELRAVIEKLDFIFY